jgi:hypothetical protein
MKEKSYDIIETNIQNLKSDLIRFELSYQKTLHKHYPFY